MEGHNAVFAYGQTGGKTHTMMAPAARTWRA